MKKLSCLAVLLTAACFAAEEVDESFPHFEGKEKAFLVTVTQDIHAYRNEDKLMMEKKSPAVKPIAPPKAGPAPLKVKMEVNPKKRKFQLTTKTTF